MTLNDLVLEKIDHVKLTDLEVRQRILEQMVQESMKEWDYLNLCLQQNREPADIFYQEGIGQLIKGAKRKSGNLITRIRALTKRNITVLNTLLSHVKDVAQGFTGKFRKSGAKKSASAIAHEALRNKLDPKKQMAESTARVKVPFEGKESQQEIELINSTLLIDEFVNDNDFLVDLMGVNYVRDDEGKKHAIADKGEGVPTTQSIFVYTNTMIYFLKHQDDLDKLCDLIIDGFKLVNGSNEVDPNDFKKDVSKLLKKAWNKANGLSDLTRFKLTMKELTSFQARASKLNEKLDFSQNGNVSMDDVDQGVISSLNELVKATEYIQYGLTSLSNAMQKVHLIDLKFMNSISDRETLAKFVYNCIQNGIPPKYIAYNTWLIANESLRGTASKYKPIAGQTRCIFFPEDNKKEILKIATSGMGITSNKNELRMSKFIKDSKEQDMIEMSALITNSYYEDSIVAMERVVDKVGKHPDLSILSEMKNKYIDFTKRHPELRLVFWDFNDGNVMWSSDKERWVCIDYGIGKRDATNAKKLEKDAEKRTEKREEEQKKESEKDDN